MCSSSYQRLNSASNSASTSVHTISNPVPRVLLIVVSSSAEDRSSGCFRGQDFAGLDRRARAQQPDPDPQGWNGAQCPAGTVAAGQAEQQREREGAQQRADLAERQYAAGHCTGTAGGCQAGGLGQQNAVP